jgi:hypothetical protein
MERNELHGGNSDQLSESEVTSRPGQPLLWQIIIDALSAETVDSGAWAKAVAFTALPSHYLPLLGLDANFIRTISAMEPRERHDYLDHLPEDLLAPDEYREWRRLCREYSIIGERMLGFWRTRRQL